MRLRLERITSFFNYRRFFRWTATTVLTTTTVAGLATIGIGGLSCYKINQIRPRIFTDNYHLNPEVLRMPYRNVNFSTNDGVQLEGWWIPSTIQGVQCFHTFTNTNKYH